MQPLVSCTLNAMNKIQSGSGHAKNSIQIMDVVFQPAHLAQSSFLQKNTLQNIFLYLSCHGSYIAI